MGGQAGGQQGGATPSSASSYNTPTSWNPSGVANSPINNGFGGYNGQSAANAQPQQNPYQPPPTPWQQAGNPWQAGTAGPTGIPNNPWFNGGPAAVAQRAQQVAPSRPTLPPQASQQAQQAIQQVTTQAPPVLQNFQELQASQARGRELDGQGNGFFSWGNRRFL